MIVPKEKVAAWVPPKERDEAYWDDLEKGIEEMLNDRERRLKVFLAGGGVGVDED